MSQCPSGTPLAGCFECRAPFLTAPGFAFLPELGAAERRAAVAAFERAVLRRLGWRCLAIAYRQVGAGDLDAVRGPRRVQRGTCPAVWVENRWTSLDGYFAWLPRRRRQHFRQLHRRLSADPELKIEIGPSGIGPAEAVEAARLARITGLRHRRVKLPVALPAAAGRGPDGRGGAVHSRP